MAISNKTGITIAMIAVVVIATSAMPGQRKFKNLKVLPKNISEQELGAVMKHYSKALGVKCTFCHVKDGNDKLDAASDAKPEKQVARKMIKMTDQINKKYFHAKASQIAAVDCITCHRGGARPDTSLIVKFNGGIQKE